MNKLEEFFWNKPKRYRIYKFHHYFEIYHNHFEQFIGKSPNILEIGVSEGGSLEMWNDYFDGDCQIYGVDVQPLCKNIESGFDNVKVFIGDQGDRTFWSSFKEQTPKMDIIVDDGSHIMEHMTTTFEELYEHVSDDGVYLLEDLQTCFSPRHNGGLEVDDGVPYLKDNTFIEYSKQFIDLLYGWDFFDYPNSEIRDRELFLEFAKETDSIHFYKNITVLQKRKTLEKLKSTYRPERTNPDAVMAPRVLSKNGDEYL